MVKPKPQASPQADSPEAPPLHPLLRNVGRLDELHARAQKRKEQTEFKIEELASWKETLNRIAATPDGQLLLKSMVQFSGLMSPRSISHTMLMVEDKLKAAFYLTWVRPFLAPQLRKDIE